MEFLRKLFLPITATLHFIQNYFKSLIFLLIVFLIFAPDDTRSLQQPNLQKIKLSGAIADAEKILEQIEEAKENSNIKGAMLVVSSPGGAVAPSVEISLAIKGLKEIKPVVAYAAGTMASGSYYASIWANEIIANPGSIIGSIGVIMEGLNLQKLIEKIGISPQIAKAGKYKEIGTPSRKWSKVERAEIEKVINSTYNMFVDDVAKARGLSAKKHTEFADAHIFTAAQAKEVGLVDSLGVMQNAEKRLQKLSGVKYPVWTKEDKFDKFMEKLGGEIASKLSMLFSDMVMR